MNIEFTELTPDSIPDLLLYSFYDGGKFSQENHLYIYQNPFSVEKLIFSHPLLISISSYDENLEKIGESNVVNVDFAVERVNNESKLKFNGIIDNNRNSIKEFEWNSRMNKFIKLPR